jgi:hypothetical protein
MEDEKWKVEVDKLDLGLCLIHVLYTILLCGFTKLLGVYKVCYNLNLGFATKAKACKGASEEGSPRVTSHVPGNVGKCGGMNLHIPKWAPTLGVRVLIDFWIFKEWL